MAQRVERWVGTPSMVELAARHQLPGLLQAAAAALGGARLAGEGGLYETW